MIDFSYFCQFRRWFFISDDTDIHAVHPDAGHVLLCFLHCAGTFCLPCRYIPLPHVVQTLRLVFEAPARSLFSGCLFLLFLTARIRLNFLDLLRGVARKIEAKRLLVPAG